MNNSISKEKNKKTNIYNYISLPFLILSIYYFKEKTIKTATEELLYFFSIISLIWNIYMIKLNLKK